MQQFQFGTVVVVAETQIGLIVKSWANNTYDVYVRSTNSIESFSGNEIKHYVYSKELSRDERRFYGA